MGLRKNSLVGGEFYHIYNRGNNKQLIFLDDEDRDRFIKLLYLCNSKKKINFRDDIIRKEVDAWDFDRGDQLVYIGVWVLMPNHFHLYITSPLIEENRYIIKNNNISIFMSKLCTAYTMYFNRKYNRTGGLFENKFKSVYLENEIQAKYLFSYIHLNPVKLIQSDWKEKGIHDIKIVIEFLDKYRWSSYLDYKGINRKEGRILDRVNFLNYFDGIKDFEKEIFDWIVSFKNLPKESPLQGIVK